VSWRGGRTPVVPVEGHGTARLSPAQARVGDRRAADGPRDDPWTRDVRPCRLPRAPQGVRGCAVCAFPSPPAVPPCACPGHRAAPVRRLTVRIASKCSPAMRGYRVSYGGMAAHSEARADAGGRQVQRFDTY
jgi:hypothetical protein